LAAYKQTHTHKGTAMPWLSWCGGILQKEFVTASCSLFSVSGSTTQIYAHLEA